MRYAEPPSHWIGAVLYASSSTSMCFSLVHSRQKYGVAYFLKSYSRLRRSTKSSFFSWSSRLPPASARLFSYPFPAPASSSRCRLLHAQRVAQPVRRARSLVALVENRFARQWVHLEPGVERVRQRWQLVLLRGLTARVSHRCRSGAGGHFVFVESTSMYYVRVAAQKL